MPRVPPKSRGFIDRAAQARIQAREAAPAAKAQGGLQVGLGPRAGAGQAAVAPLVAAQVPEKLAQRYAPELAAASKDLAALAAVGQRLEGHHAKQFGRVLEGVYKLLGRALDAAPEGERAALVQASLPALRGLVEAVGPTELLGPVMTGLSGLVDHGLRLEGRARLAPTPEERRQTFSAAAEGMQALLQRYAGRDGLAVAATCLPVLAEHAERATPDLTPKGRVALWDAAIALLSAAPPQEGLDLALAAQLTRRVADAIKGGASGLEALVRARDGYVEAHAVPLPDGLRARVEAQPAGPARTAAAALLGRLEALVAASPASGAALAPGAEALLAAAEAQLQAPHGPAAVTALAAVVGRLAGSPAAQAGLQVLAAHAEVLLAPGREAALAAAAKARSGADLADGLLALMADRVGAAPQGALRGLDDARALLVAFTAVEQGAVPHLAAVALRAAAPLDRPARTLAAFATRYGQAAAALAPRLGERPELASAVARAVEGSPEPGPRVAAMAQQLALVAETMPKVRLDEVLVGAGGRPGLATLTEPGRTRFSPAEDFLEPLLREAGPKLGGDAGKQLEVTRLAIGLADVMSGIAGNANPLFSRVRKDLAAALDEPHRLAGGPAGGGVLAVRAGQGAPTLSGAFARLDALPPELVLTAALHLDPKQQAWLQETLSKRVGLNEARQLRDTVCAAVETGNLGLIDALRTTKSSGKAVSAVTREVAMQFRAGKLAEVNFAALEAGLRAGQDPVAQQEGARLAAQLQGLDLAALTEGKLDPKGVADVMACGQIVGMMLSQFVDGYQPPMDTQIKYGELRPALLDVLKNVASGHWPAPKYEGEVNSRIMGRLSPKAQAVWRETGLTSAQPPAADAVVDAQLAEALTLLKGVAKLLPDAVRLSAPGLALTWDQASYDAVRAKQADLLNAFRGAEKGSPAHREASRALGPTRAAAAALELHLALARALAPEAEGPREVVTRLTATLEATKGALRKVASPELVRVLDEVQDAARGIAPKKREGTYAADEDTLPALITSHQSGCLSAGWGVRIWGLPGAAADANIKMLRVYRGDKQVWRTFLKFFPVKFEGYEGPALWVENPVADGGGDARERALLYKHALEKGQQMGLPVMCGADYDPGYDDLAQLARGMGREVKSGIPVKLFFEQGNTPVQHSDGVLSTTQGSNVNNHGRIRDFRGENEFWERDKTMRTVVMPQV
jgi:hypothetical protein